MIAIIAAYSDRRVIGNAGDLPWRGEMPADLRHFQRITSGSTVIMGRLTFESIGRPLPKRRNIIVTSTAVSGVDTAPSLPAALRLVDPDDSLFIIGGTQLFTEAMGVADALYITEIHADYAGDRYFPAIDPEKWQVVSRQDCLADEQNVHAYSFVEYRRVKQR